MSTPGELLEALSREARRLTGQGGAAEAAPRVYRARSVEELIPRIERELGSDAVIIARRDGLTGGVLGFFQHPYVEIEALPGPPRLDVYDAAEAAAPAGVGPYGEPPPPPPAGQVPPAPGQPGYGQPLPAQPGFAAQPAPGAPGAAPYSPPPGAGPSPYAQPPGAQPAPLQPQPAPPAQQPAPAWQPAAGAQPGLAAQLQPQAPAGQPAAAPLAPPGYPLAAYQAAAGAQQAPYAQAAQQAPPAVPAAPVLGASGPYVTPELAALARAERYPEPPPAPAPAPPASIAPRATAAPVVRIPAPAPVDFGELLPPRTAPAAPPAPAPERRTVAPGSQARARAGVERTLRRYGLSEELARELIDAAAAHTLPFAPRSGLAAAVRATLAQRIPVAPPLPAQGAAVVIVGAGGAGKTTCCAAMLGAYRAASTLPARCATLLDGTAELSMLLAPDLMRPTAAASPRALRALRRARAEGLAIVDTPHISPSERSVVRRLARLIGEIEPERVMVALPATVGPGAAGQLLEALAPLGANALAVTHADETDQLGVVVEAACRHGLAPEYLLERARGGGWRLRRGDPVGLAERLLP